MAARLLVAIPRRRAAPAALKSSRWSSRRFASSSTGKTTAQEAEQTGGGLFSRDWKVPAALGFTLIGFLQWHHLNNPTEEERKAHPAPALRRLPGEKTVFEETMATERQLQSLKLFPYRAASRLWGEVHDKELPGWLREPVYKAWTAVFDCKLDEMRYPLESYANLGEFFSRPLKDGARVFDSNPRHIASPVDGTVASIGVVDNSSSVPTLEQVKGARYRLDEFLGSVPSFFSSAHDELKRGKKMYHCVLYLAPGDYHRIHAPVDWSVSERRHFPGNLFPVNKIAARLIPSLFVENERVALLGEWEHGFFSLTAVGATNVGSIVLSREPEFRSNTKDQDALVGKCFSKEYAGSPEAARGEEMAQFKLGSTVVLVFEAPESFEFTINPGDKDYQEPVSVADFVAEVGVDPSTGLDRAAAMTRRELYGSNRVTPPISCPSWVCCLLPCLLRTPSMRAFTAALPRESTVRRRIAGPEAKPRTRRMRMDAMSLVYGDVVELSAGDVVGADMRVIECSDDCVVDQSVLTGGAGEEDDEEQGQRGRKRVATASPPAHQREDPLASSNILLMATELVQGSAVAVVVATGDHTVWGDMVAQHQWPPASGASRRTRPEERELMV